MMICISSLDWANIAESVPTLKQHLPLLGGVSVSGVNNVCLSSLMCGEQHLITVTVLVVNEAKLKILMLNPPRPVPYS